MGSPERITHISQSKAVLIDVDNTINKLQAHLFKYVNRRSIQTYLYRQFTSAQMESTDTPFDKLAEEYFGFPELVIQSRPFPKALEGTKLLHENGFELHIASARHESLYPTTLAWLEKHGFLSYVTDVHRRTPHISGTDFKRGVAKKINAATAFDDEKLLADALASIGIPVYLIRRPWNIELKRSDLIRPHSSFYRAALSFLNS